MLHLYISTTFAQANRGCRVCCRVSLRRTGALLALLMGFTLNIRAQAPGRVGIHRPTGQTPDSTLTVNGGGRFTRAVQINDYQLPAAKGQPGQLLTVPAIGGRLTWQQGLRFVPGQGLVVGEGPVGVGTVTVGDSLSLTSSNYPLRGAFPDVRAVYLYLASELTAAGLRPGPIADLSFNVASKLSTGAFQNFTLKLGSTTATGVTGFPAAGATQQVYSASYTTAVGWNRVVFQTPFQWDGTSNLLIEICFDNAAGISDDFIRTRVAGGSRAFATQSPAVGAVGCALTAASSSVSTTTVPVVRFRQATAYTLPAGAGSTGQVLTQQANGTVAFQAPPVTPPQFSLSGATLTPVAPATTLQAATLTGTTVNGTTVNGTTINGTTVQAGTLTFPAPTGDPAPVITARTVPSGQGGATERTELILFHGNDGANGFGEDLITLRAPALRFQTYTNSGVTDIANNVGANDRLYITPGGNVGVGTNTPGQRLDVNGTVRATAHTYATPQTRELVLPPSAFASVAPQSYAYVQNVTPNAGINYGLYGYLASGNNTQYGYVVAPVSLPQGAVITGLTLTASDGDNSSFSPAADLTSVTFSTQAAIYNITDLQAKAALTTESPNWQTVTTAVNHTVNNSTGLYQVVVRLRQNSAGMLFGAVRITYTVTSPD